MDIKTLAGVGWVKCGECTFNPDGHCHLYPPKPFLVGAQNALGQTIPQIIGANPPVQDKGYCAQGEPRPIQHVGDLVDLSGRN